MLIVVKNQTLYKKYVRKFKEKIYCVLLQGVFVAAQTPRIRKLLKRDFSQERQTVFDLWSACIKGKSCFSETIAQIKKKKKKAISVPRKDV